AGSGELLRVVVHDLPAGLASAHDPGVSPGVGGLDLGDHRDGAGTVGHAFAALVAQRVEGGETFEHRGGVGLPHEDLGVQVGVEAGAVAERFVHRADDGDDLVDGGGGGI